MDYTIYTVHGGVRRTYTTEPEFVNLSGAQESIPKKSIPPAYVEAWGTGTTTRQVTKAGAEAIPWNRFRGSLKVYKFGLSGDN